MCFAFLIWGASFALGCELLLSGGAPASLVVAARGILIRTDSLSGMCFFLALKVCGASQLAPRPQHIEHGRKGRLSSHLCCVHFRKSHVCASKLDVQETDFSFAQFYRR